MDYCKLIDEKKSIRDYKKKKVADKKISEVKDFIVNSKRLNQDLKIDILFMNNEDVFEKLDGVCGYEGKMLYAPHYAFIFSEEGPHYLENSGYVGELLSLKLFEMGIDSCFISFDDSDIVKEKLSIKNDYHLGTILALGYGEQRGGIFNFTKAGGNYSKAKLGVKDRDTIRHTITEITYMSKWGNNATFEELEMRMLDKPLFYSRLAPSSFNRQPWRFIIDNNIVVLAIKSGNNSYNDAIDAGIQMLYFDLITSSTLTNVDWVMGKPEKEYKIPDDFEIMGYVKI